MAEVDLTPSFGAELKVRGGFFFVEVVFILIFQTGCLQAGQFMGKRPVWS